MPNTAATPPGTTAGNNAFVGTVDWTSSGNITVSDSSYATAAIGTTLISHGLTGTNFGFTVPAATGDGINARWRRKGPAAGGAVGDNAIRLIKAGTVQATDKSLGGNWSSTEGNFDYGGATDKWSDTWAHTDFNNSGFGAALSAKQTSGTSPTASVNYLEVTAYYTATATSTGNWFLLFCVHVPLLLTFPWRNWLLVRRGLPGLTHYTQSAQSIDSRGRRYLDPVAAVLNLLKGVSQWLRKLQFQSSLIPTSTASSAPQHGKSGATALRSPAMPTIVAGMWSDRTPAP